MRLDDTYLVFKKKHLLFWICLPFLYAASLLYRAVVAVLQCAYRLYLLPSYRPKIIVISVGNITLGGTGKTPLVENIASFLRQSNKKAGIIIRGYRGLHRARCEQAHPAADYLQFGDEASMLKANLSDTITVCVGRDKNKSARQLEAAKCDVAIVDDGFQHWRLKRDLDIVTIDSTFALFDQKVLPVGRLREPLGSLKRADVFVLTKTDFNPENTRERKEELQKINPRALIVSSIYEPMCFSNVSKSGERCDLSLAALKAKAVFIVMGIGNPFYFDKLISGDAMHR